MRRILCLALGLALSAPAVPSVLDWLIPSPVAVVLQVGKWIYNRQAEKEVYYIRVQSTGSTEAEARDQAFRLAVDQAVGSLMVSETEINNGTLNRHDVINYSSGYIHNFEYVNVHRDSDSVTVQMDVWVEKSSIADRLSGTVDSATNIQGYKISESFRSKANQKTAGDTLLENLLSEYPHKAYEHTITSIDYTTSNRKPKMIVNFSAQWRSAYLDSLAEVFANIGIRAKTHVFSQDVWNMQFVRENCVLCKADKFMIENTQTITVLERFRWHVPAVQITLLDRQSNKISEQCGWYDNMIGDSYGNDNLHENNGPGLDFYTDRSVNHAFYIDLTQVDIEKLDQVVLNFTTVTNCKNQK